MSEDASAKYISEHDLSIAFLDYVSSRLSAAGYTATNAAVADAIGVHPSMVSQVWSGSKALHYRTIAQYARKIDTPVGEVFREVARKAGEEANEPSVETPLRNSGRILSDVVSEIQELKELLWRSPGSGRFDAERAYRKVAARALGVLKHLELPVIAVGVRIRQGRQDWLLSCRADRDGRSVVFHRLTNVPSSLQRALGRVGGAESESALYDTCVVICPGERAYGQARDEEEASLEFWENLTGLTHASHGGSKLRVISECAFEGQGAGEDSDAVSLFFLFEFGFVPPEEVRESLRILAWPVLQVKAQSEWVSISKVRLSDRSGEGDCPGDSRLSPSNAEAGLDSVDSERPEFSQGPV